MAAADFGSAWRGHRLRALLRRALWRAGLAVGVLAGLAVVLASPERAAQPQAGAPASPCGITTTERIVAIGDVHGAFDRFVTILRDAGLIDARNHWSGGRAVFVQTGDLLDRGPDSRKALDLVMALTAEAPRSGGTVYPLLGNHEVMRLMRDLRYVSAGEYAAFKAPNSGDVRDRYYRDAVDNAKARARAIGQKFDEGAFRKQFNEQIPLGYIEMQAAFAPESPYGQWLRARDTVAEINDIAFVHGGFIPEVAALGCDAINRNVKAELRMRWNLDDSRLLSTLSAGPNGPLWYRGLADETMEVPLSEVDTIRKSLRAHTIVIGHTVAPELKIRTRYAGRVVQIDTGMLGGTFYPGGRASALEIQGDTMTVIADGKREPLK